MVGEYISREAVLSFPFANGQYDREHADEHFIHGCESYREWIEQLPAADVVEVVRCRECVYHEYDAEIDACVCTGAMAYGTVPNDWYCAGGKRKDGGQEDV